MISGIIYEDGVITYEMDLHEARYNHLMRKKGEQGLSGDEMRELDRNKFVQMGRDIIEQASYGLMALRHAEKNKNNPKD